MFQQLLPFVIIGIATGAVYGLAGTGLVLTYKTSGIFNFAYGSNAALAVFVFYWLHDQHQMPWPLAALICLGVMSPAEGLLMEVLARALEGASATLKVAATVGLLLAVLGVGTLWFGNNLGTFPQFLPSETVHVAGVNIAWYQIIVVIISVVATAVLYYFFRFVRLGVAMRGVVDNPDLVSMTGEDPVRVRRWAWLIGTVFASMAGLLLAPSLSLDALVITMLVVQAFGAAAIGYFSSLPLTFAGGLVIGVAGSVATKYVATIAWLSGLPAGLPFIVLLLVLVVTPRARLAERRVPTAAAVRRAWYAPLRVRLAVGAGVLALLAFVPQLTGPNLPVWSEFLIDVVLFLSLGLLVRVAGQISLCHLAFAAVGAAAFGRLTDDWHVPWLLALLLATIAAVPIGALIAIPAIRLSGVFLALATFGFGILLEQMIYTTSVMFGPTTAGIPVPRPDISILGWHLWTDTGFYYLLLLIAMLGATVVIAIQRTRMGRLLGGLADSPVALETHGATTNVTRVLVFCVSAAMASMTGALTSVLFHYAVGSNFSSFESLVLVALVVIVVGGDPWYAVLAALGYAVLPGYVNVSNISTYLEIAFGVFATLYALQRGRIPPVPMWVRGFVDRIGGRRPEAALASETSATTLVGTVHPVRRTGGDPRAGAAAANAQGLGAAVRAAPEDHSAAGNRSELLTSRGGLEVLGLSVHFGGIRALQDVSLTAPSGRITGLVGPNGAGKTTLFNACSGLLKPTSGSVLLHGRDVSHLGPAARSRMGLGRTFQRANLFDSLNVRENVELGREASIAGANPLTHMLSRRSDRPTLRRAAEEAISLAGVASLRELQAGLLPTGQRRLVELASALAASFDVLLLDEPSSGLDAGETHRFGEVLTEVVRARGAGVLLVEHDMSLVREICEYVYVLDFGSLIFEGSPQEMLGSTVVRSAYLGEEHVGQESPSTTEVGAARALVADGPTASSSADGGAPPARGRPTNRPGVS